MSLTPRKPYNRFDVRRLADLAARSSTDPRRHKCFISYHSADADAVGDFINNFGTEFIPRSVGISEDDFIGSDDDEYVMRLIREKYLTDSTVTIVLLGECTWARKFIDWEIASSLRNDANNKRSGLLLYPLSGNSAQLPDRAEDNWDKESDCYAYYLSYPGSTAAVRRNIENAFQARDGKAHLVNNRRALFRNNRYCTS